ncbi:MAG: ABC transporter ATP-binding protein [Alphaproteobacteria bacterium]|nr:ABC transporter ATP-binding protein [Alphaproteobacteria bacterium]
MGNDELYIEVANLSHSFGTKQVLSDISFNVARGEVLGFLGPNGAGKTTTMRMISGFLNPDSGTIKIEGVSLQQGGDALRAKIGYLPEGAPLWGDLYVQDYLSIMAGLRGMKGKNRNEAVQRVMADTQLSDVLNQPIQTLSKGFKRRVCLAQAFLSNPDIMILDEPTDGLDPNQKHQMRELIKRVAVDKAIIISTHILEEVDALCSRVMLLADGEVKFNGTPKEFYNSAPKNSKNQLEDAFRLISQDGAEAKKIDKKTAKKTVGSDKK